MRMCNQKLRPSKQTIYLIQPLKIILTSRTAIAAAQDTGFDEYVLNGSA